ERAPLQADLPMISTAVMAPSLLRRCEGEFIVQRDGDSPILTSRSRKPHMPGVFAPSGGTHK
ncbi:hypothetical protein DOI34_25090, partial [Salmonella enterica subsp. enterica serovar Virchow]|nr:hypothetical protein [Salmonella enterica subsp. enterica serovar Virchow]